MKNLLKLLSTAFFALLFANAGAQKFEQPVLISSAGQSADVKLVQLLANKQKLDSKTVLMATPDDLNGIKTLIVVPGFSSKGLGAAGVSQQQEFERVKTLIEKANAMKIPIVMVHIGGSARRKGQSDAFNQFVADNSKQMIVVRQGDEDGFFTQIANSKKIPLAIVDKISETEIPMGELFK